MLAINRLQCCGKEKNKLKQQSAVNTEALKTILKHYYEFYFKKLYSKLLPSPTSVIKHNMSAHRLPKSQYTIQKNVKLFSNLISQLDDQCSSHTSAVVTHFAHCNSIGYLVHR